MAKSHHVGYGVDVPTFKRLSVGGTPLKNGPPGEATLCAIQDDVLHYLLVVSAWNSPLFIVVPSASYRAVTLTIRVSMASAYLSVLSRGYLHTGRDWIALCILQVHAASCSVRSESGCAWQVLGIHEAMCGSREH